MKSFFTFTIKLFFSLKGLTQIHKYIFYNIIQQHKKTREKIYHFKITLFLHYLHAAK